MFEQLNLNIDEKFVISNLVYSDVGTAAVSKGLDLKEVTEKITPARTIYFWLEPIENSLIQNAFTAIQSNPTLRLTLTEWTALIWMAENGIDRIVSDREEIDRLLNDPTEFSDIPRIGDRLKNIKRI